MTPESYKEMQVDTKGEFGGLGIQIGIKDNALTVIAPIEDTPADKAGIKAGDKITKINNVSTKDMRHARCCDEDERGPKDPGHHKHTQGGMERTKDFTIVRDIIKIKSVKSKVLENNIGYIKLSQFQEQTAEDLAVAIKQLNDSKVTALILDLRNDPGGLLNSAIDVSQPVPA